MWFPEFISVISITPGICNRCQNGGGEEKQKGAWESILMRKKREVHITRTARSQSTHGPPQRFPTGSKLSHLAWFPKETSAICSHAPWVCLSSLPASTQFHTATHSQRSGHPSVLQNQEDWDVLGAAGLQWGNRAHSLRYSLLVFRQATQNVGLLCLVACGTIAFLYYDFCEVVLHPCGLMQGIRDLANLHLGNPQQYEESQHAAARGLTKAVEVSTYQTEEITRFSQMSFSWWITNVLT